ncbi:MAG: DUF3786 domain-containing protein [Thermodesulforhabdaceae bacterium]|jgi:hypothetical protein
MSGENYKSIIQSYLDRAFARGIDLLRISIPAHLEDDKLEFKAFGANCFIKKDGVFIDGYSEEGPKGVLVSIYALYAPQNEIATVTSWQAFRDLPNSMPYWGAFRSNAEEPLIPFVEKVFSLRREICDWLGGYFTSDTPGDFAFVVFPFPKIPLLYIFYLPDEEFPAEAKCLFAAQDPFMPVDALADVAEHTSRLMIEFVEKNYDSKKKIGMI